MKHASMYILVKYKHESIKNNIACSYCNGTIYKEENDYHNYKLSQIMSHVIGKPVLWDSKFKQTCTAKETSLSLNFRYRNVKTLPRKRPTNMLISFPDTQAGWQL